jgi:hypothetical protein
MFDYNVDWDTIVSYFLMCDIAGKDCVQGVGDSNCKCHEVNGFMTEDFNCMGFRMEDSIWKCVTWWLLNNLFCRMLWLRSQCLL